jgi:formate/nitrite transporter
MILAVASRKVSARSMWRNWILVYAANAAGALLLAFAVHHTGILDGGGIRVTAARVAEAKAELGFLPAFLRGVLCNMLVCLAVWLSTAARSVVSKVIAIIFPVAAFVALGFEHCVANLYLLPIGVLSDANVTLAGVLGNIVPVTLGNIVGGVGLGAAYWLTYGSDRPLVGLQPQERCVDAADVRPALRRAAKEAA